MSRHWTIAVLGAGAWGTALALTMQRAGHGARLWARDQNLVREINNARSNSRYLPGVKIDPAVLATDDMAAALEGADCVLAAIPAQSLRSVLAVAGTALKAHIPVVLCAKGIERETGQLMSEAARQALPENPLAALSGPSFAADLARGLPTAVTVAAQDGALAADLAKKLSAPNLRCYSSDDLMGVELGGALKNVLAIAAGATSGAGLGASAVAAITTRGFVELRRIGAAFGARAETLMGLSGLGDLILTCNSPQSRNFAYGAALGRGERLDNLPLAEGVFTASIAARMVSERGLEAPIIETVNGMLNGGLTVHAAMQALLARPLKSE
ncbi:MULTISPECIES: NAD(P)H-dependent glycerol-3-phosphate dehydrogenase [Chelativorans]|jgi:glycerol-3-phosphate dehydrogenase (NAD(P)+)|uniref:Glycerol-3-phosphate dehydrogenase [NAD(P)+] n=1 Tax=Chelativorans sp. (strain BNC1) TaxID=266779 RepID=GPDA_CHESB|nr:MULTISPECIES: NAD(P)H-dependent glycerol-3-phosphate dehydrogenase [Chelativorans]Q11DE9.1 RecName: Full=Glycerol-3-phosphate dehydrogenase [NAD(P)+]; AltName: Full=NAD(P)H-dependent glycerol-3-phosphate dehydrogenase [Chelativorans sp. BNC1]